jgi:hypothetical protein
VLNTARQVRDQLADPALQIYPGTGMTCVFDPSKAKCKLASQDDTRRTPDLSDFRPGCQNIARTDRAAQHHPRRAPPRRPGGVRICRSGTACHKRVRPPGAVKRWR